MLVQMVVVTVVTLAIFYAPGATGNVLFAGLYAGLLYFERRLNILNWQTIVLFALALFSLTASGFSDHIGLYVPAALYGVLFAFSAIQLVRGRPMTMIYGGKYGHPSIHWRTSVLWLAVFGSALAISILMFQHLWLITLLPFIMVLGVIVTIWLQLQSKITNLVPGASFKEGELEFAEIERTDQNIDAFYIHFARETLYQTPNRVGQEARAEISVLAQEEKDRDKAQGVLSTRRYFVVRKNDEIVASISFVEMPEGWELSEIGQSLNIEDLRRDYGTIGLFDHFCIAPKFRNRPSIMQRLLRMAIEAAFEADCSFVTTFAFANIAPLYRKIGFVPLLEKSVASVRCGAELAPMMMNLSHSAICEFEEMEKRGYGRDDLIGRSNLGERYFKRQVLKSVWQRHPAWKLDILSYVRDLSSATPAPSSAISGE